MGLARCSYALPGLQTAQVLVEIACATLMEKPIIDLATHVAHPLLGKSEKRGYLGGDEVEPGEDT